MIELFQQSRYTVQIDVSKNQSNFPNAPFTAVAISSSVSSMVDQTVTINLTLNDTGSSGHQKFFVVLGSSHSILPQSDNGGTIVGYTHATSILTYLQRSEYSHIHNGTFDFGWCFSEQNSISNFSAENSDAGGRRRQLLSSVRANTCDIGNVSTNIAYKCLKNNRGTYHRIETAPKDCMGQGWDYGIFVLIYNSQFADYIFRLYSWLLFTPESADFSDKSLIHYVQNGSAPAEALALANMSRQFKMKTNSGSKSCFLKIQHIDQVCSNLSELELVVSYETDCHFFF